MKFGMNIDLRRKVPDNFILACSLMGIRDLKVILHRSSSTVRVGDDSPDLIGDLEQILIKQKMKAYYSSVYDSDLFQAFDSGFEKVIKEYELLCNGLKKGTTLGVGLPEGLYSIIKIGQGKFGIKKEKVRSQVSTLVKIIKKHGHKAVLPCRLEDVKSGLWDNIDFDVYDLEVFASPKLDIELKIPKFADKSFWFGKAGIMGGYSVAMAQMAFLRKIKGMKAEYCFLWSEDGDEKWRWTKGGKFLIDSDFLKKDSYFRPMTGNKALAAYKNKKRK